MKKILKDISYILICVVLLNIISYFIYIRWDFTATKRYSLSKVSKNIIQQNTRNIAIDFYVTEDLHKIYKNWQKNSYHCSKNTNH